MSPRLLIEARLPRPAGLEMSARLLAARPHWDIELDEDGLNFILPYQPGALDPELIVLEETCRNLERTRTGLELELKVVRLADDSEQMTASSPLLSGFGPWSLVSGLSDEESSSPARHILVLPTSPTPSRRWQAGEALLLSALADQLSPPPGAPETRGWPTLILESTLPLAPAAAVLAGSGPVVLLTDEASGSLAEELTRLNHPEQPLETISTTFKSLARKRDDWAGHFGLIAVHLSPYLAARRLKTLAGWLRPGGVLIVSGFNPGPQTAHLLRAAARAGLRLTGSVSEGDWAALTLETIPARPELPPLTGSLVPDLVDLPPSEEFPDLEVAEDETTAIPEDEGLMLTEDDDEDE